MRPGAAPYPHGAGVEDLRLQDLATFLNVHRTGSVTALAREIGVSPSQVSKAIARLEAVLHVRLFTRVARGVALSSAGRRVLPTFEQMVTLSRSLGRAEASPDGDLTIAAPSSLLPAIFPRVVNALRRTRVRGIELPPPLLRGYAAEELFDVALLSGGVTGLPLKWESVCIGEFRKALLASPAMAKRLGPRPTLAQVRAASFVGPIAHDGGKYVASTDDCPLGLEARTVASEDGTMALALLVASECDHLLFGPVIAAQREIECGALVELRVPGWNVTEELFLASDAERVKARDQTATIDAMRAALADSVALSP